MRRSRELPVHPAPSRRRLRFALAAVALIVAAAVLLLRRTPSRSAIMPAMANARTPIGDHPSSAISPKLAALAREIPADSISPIANDLDAPGGTVEHDLEIVNEVLIAWQTNFPRTGNPVGENDEITAALAGDNPLHFAFIAPTHRAINAHGQLVDRWGTPYRFHQLSGTEMELRSAGPDRKFGTADDVSFAPTAKSP